MDDRRPGQRRERSQGPAPRRVSQTKSLGRGQIRHAVHQDEDVAVHEDGDLQPVPGDPEPAKRLEDPVRRRDDAQQKDHRDGAEDTGAQERSLAKPLRLRRELPPAEGEGEKGRRPRDEGLDDDQDRHDRKRRGQAGGDELCRESGGRRRSPRQMPKTKSGRTIRSAVTTAMSAARAITSFTRGSIRVRALSR